MKHPSKQAPGPTINRIADVMEHSDRYAFHGVKHLAEDSGLSEATISRITNNRVNPKFATVALIAKALRREFGLPIDAMDLMATNADFPTRYTCDLVGCPGCLPEIAVDELGVTNPAYRSIEPGCWVTSRYPGGFIPQKGAM